MGYKRLHEIKAKVNAQEVAQQQENTKKLRRRAMQVATALVATSIVVGNIITM